jgi:hypothetical protein
VPEENLRRRPAPTASRGRQLEDSRPNWFANAAEWTAWRNIMPAAPASGCSGLQKRRSVWFFTATIQEALDGALCYGWIDGQRKKPGCRKAIQRHYRLAPNAAPGPKNQSRQGRRIDRQQQKDAPGLQVE